MSRGGVRKKIVGATVEQIIKKCDEIIANDNTRLKSVAIIIKEHALNDFKLPELGKTIKIVQKIKEEKQTIESKPKKQRSKQSLQRAKSYELNKKLRKDAK